MTSDRLPPMPALPDPLTGRDPAGLVPDFERLAAEIERTVIDTAAAARADMPGYSRAKARALAGYTLLIGEAHAAGELDADGLAREMEELDRMVMRFVRTMTALANTLAEALIDALAALLRRVLSLILGPLAVLPS